MLSDREILNNALTAIRAGIDGDSSVADERERNMSYYLGEPLGNEVEGRSQVLSRDVFDVVESVLPELVKVFTTSDNYVQFDAVGPEDEEGAQQETDYVNHVFTKKNNGFKVIYDWFKDALISKNGIVKCYWEDKSEPRKEEYKGLTEMEMVSLLMREQDSVEIVSQDTRIEEVSIGGQLAQVQVYDLELKRINDKSGVRIEVVPPEEFIVSRDASSVDLSVADMMAHKVRRTRSWLRAQGYDKGLIEKIGQGEIDAEFNDERYTRRHLEHESYEEDNGDESMREVWVYECFMKMDVDQDGIAEWWKFVVANDTLLDKEEVDRPIFHALTPTPITHKFYGSCPADETADIQEIKTAHLRQMNDNMYSLNNGRVAVNENVNLDDLLTPRVGGVVRVDTKDPVAGNLMQFQTHAMIGDSLSALGYIDKIKEDRTGVSDVTQGLDPNLLAKTNTGVFNQAEQNSRSRIGLIARIFAETGVKSLFLHIHELLQKHQQKSEVVKLRNRWIEVNPTEWRERTDMSIDIGLGTNSQADKRNGLLLIQQSQQALAPFGLITAKEAYNTFAKVVENEGFKNPALFAMNPEEAQLPPPQPDQQAIAMQQQVQLAQQQLQQQAQKDAAENHRKTQELAIKEQEVQLKADALMADAAEAKAKIDADFAELELKREEMLLKYSAEPSDVEPVQDPDIDSMVYGSVQRAFEERNNMVRDVVEPLAESIANSSSTPARRQISIMRDQNGDISGATVDQGE